MKYWPEFFVICAISIVSPIIVAGCADIPPKVALETPNDSGSPAVVLGSIKMEWGQIVDIVAVGSLDEWFIQHKQAEIIALTSINQGRDGYTSRYYIVYRLHGK